MSRYVALGSSMAAGPGIRPAAEGAPFRAARSARNYPHLVAAQLGHDLVDVTYSGATTANVLTDSQHGAPPQIDALDGSEDLVTVTIGGNDVGYVQFLFAAGLPRMARSLPLLGRLLRGQLDPAARDRALVDVAESLKEVGRTLRQRSPRAKVLFVDYLTLLPPAGTPASPLSDTDLLVGRRIANTLERLTAEAAADTGCEVVRVAQASRDHHAWSAKPWTTKNRFAVFVQTRPSCAAASQRRRNAGGRRPGRRTGELTAWADERAGGPDQGLRPNPRRRRPDLLDRTRHVTGFLGPNGAGKTTTMRMILGLDHPTSGTATIDGKAYRQLTDPLRTVGRCWTRGRRTPTARRETTCAGSHDQPLSLGMSQRLGVAGALLGDPSVLLFDGPVNGLDPEGIRWVRTLMRTLAATRCRGKRSARWFTSPRSPPSSLSLRWSTSTAATRDQQPWRRR